MTLHDNILPYRDDIIHIARAKNIDPSFCAAICAWESGGHADAGKDKYAYDSTTNTYRSLVTFSQGIGLMQVCPREAPNPVFANRPGVAELLEPNVNLAYGIDILAEGLRHCGTKTGAAVQYFTGSGCRPSGLSDPNGNDYTYVAGVLRLEGYFLDFNEYDPDVLEGLRGVARAWKADFEALGAQAVNVGTQCANIEYAALAQLHYTARVDAWKHLISGGK